MKQILLALLFVLGSILLACSDDDGGTKPNPDDEINLDSVALETLYPLAIGDYRIYQAYDLDENGEKQEGSERTDSSFVFAQIQKSGKTAFEIHDVDNIIGEVVKQYVSRDGETLYEWTNSLVPKYLVTILPFGEDDDLWVKVIDREETEWQAFEYVFDNFESPLFSGAVVNGTMTATAKKGQTPELEIKGELKAAQEYLLTITMEGTVTYNGEIQDLNLESKLRSYFVPELGLVKRTWEKFSATFMGTPIGSPASEEVLIDYSLEE